MSKSPKDEQYSEAEAQRRFEKTLGGALKTPPKPKEATRKPPSRRSGK